MVVQRDTPPSPGSQAYRDLPAVSVSCVLSFLFLLFFANLFHCRSLLLAAMKSAVPSAGAISPAFDLQEHKVTRYVNVICMCFQVACYVTDV